MMLFDVILIMVPYLVIIIGVIISSLMIIVTERIVVKLIMMVSMHMQVILDIWVHYLWILIVPNILIDSQYWIMKYLHIINCVLIEMNILITLVWKLLYECIDCLFYRHIVYYRQWLWWKENWKWTWYWNWLVNRIAFIDIMQELWLIIIILICWTIRKMKYSI